MTSFLDEEAKMVESLASILKEKATTAVSAQLAQPLSLLQGSATEEPNAKDRMTQRLTQGPIIDMHLHKTKLPPSSFLGVEASEANAASSSTAQGIRGDYNYPPYPVVNVVFDAD